MPWRCKSSKSALATSNLLNKEAFLSSLERSASSEAAFDEVGKLEGSSFVLLRGVTVDGSSCAGGALLGQKVNFPLSYEPGEQIKVSLH